MIEPAPAPDETARIATLRGLGILDTPPEERFDRITRLAQKIFDVPIAVVSLVDVNRQWFKSCQGLDASETPRSISFCGHAILGTKVFVIEDAAADARFADNPLVTGGPRIRFYAGAPLRTHGGHAAGALCIIAPTPRRFGPRDQELLAELANSAIAELENVHTAARERELRDFIETAGAIIQSVDESGRLLMINRAWKAALGYSSEEALRQNVLDLIDPAEHEHYHAVIAKLLASDPPVAMETTFIAKYCRKLRLSGVLNALRRADGRMETRGVFHDVTAQRELERIRSEVTHHVSHELKIPSAITSLALSMLADSGAEFDAEQRQLLETAQKAAEHSSRMAEDLLDASTSDSGQLRVEAVPRDVSKALAGIDAALTSLAAKAGLTLTVKLPTRKISAVFDGVRLHQILINLIGNAIKFTPPGGRITVGTKDGDKKFVEIFVQDTGLGMKKEDLDRIFDRLYQTVNKALQGAVGLGLGLHLCRELVTAHGGRIWVDSEPGKGTTFHFTLPLA